MEGKESFSKIVNGANKGNHAGIECIEDALPLIEMVRSNVM